MRCAALRCVLVDLEVNVDKCKEVEDKVLRCYYGWQNAHNYSFHKKDPSKYPWCKTAKASPGGSTVAVPEIEVCSNWRTE